MPFTSLTGDTAVAVAAVASIAVKEGSTVETAGGDAKEAEAARAPQAAPATSTSDSILAVEMSERLDRLESGYNEGSIAAERALSLRPGKTPHLEWEEIHLIRLLQHILQAFLGQSLLGIECDGGDRTYG